MENESYWGNIKDTKSTTNQHYIFCLHLYYVIFVCDHTSFTAMYNDLNSAINNKHLTVLCRLNETNMNMNINEHFIDCADNLLSLDTFSVIRYSVSFFLIQHLKIIRYIKPRYHTLPKIPFGHMNFWYNWWYALTNITMTNVHTTITLDNN